MITVRRAQTKDIPKIMELLRQVHGVHYAIRSDIFKPTTTKYTVTELSVIMADSNRPIFVAVDEQDIAQGYAFCIIKEIKDNLLLNDRKELYIDDLCVEGNHRGEHIGTELYEYTLQYAKEISADYITLNVWQGNDSAMAFYEAMGMTPRSLTMETKLKYKEDEKL